MRGAGKTGHGCALRGPVAGWEGWVRVRGSNDGAANNLVRQGHQSENDAWISIYS